MCRIAETPVGVLFGVNAGILESLHGLKKFNMSRSPYDSGKQSLMHRTCPEDTARAPAGPLPIVFTGGRHARSLPE